MCGLFAAVGRGIDPAELWACASAAAERGPHAWGVAVPDEDGDPAVHRQTGRLRDARPAFTDATAGATVLIGHARLATSSDYRNLRDAQPLLSRDGLLAVAHNGVVSNAAALLADARWTPETENDSEAILATLVRRRQRSAIESPLGAIQETVAVVEPPSPMALLALWGGRPGAHLVVSRRGQPLYYYRTEGALYLGSKRWRPECPPFPEDSALWYSPAYAAPTHELGGVALRPAEQEITSPFGQIAAQLEQGRGD